MPTPLRFHVTLEAERALRAGHPWVYAEALRKAPAGGAAGEFVALYDRRNRFLALGLYDPESPLRVRVLQRFKPAVIDAAWYAQRLHAALKLRRALLADPHTTGFRLVHGENDGLPGVVVDRYDQTLVLKLYTAAWAPHLDALKEALIATYPAQRLVLRLSRAACVARVPAAGWTDGRVLAGAAGKAPVAFLERGLRFEADVVHGQKTGFFLDQRENRALLERFSRGRIVLDAFAYTGAFSVAAARGGAREVLSVDLSGQALVQAERHVHLNRGALPPRLSFRMLKGDAFEVLPQLATRRQRFSLVVLDPPAFAHSQAQVRPALAAYARLVRAGLGVLAPEGLLMIASCSGHVGADAFYTAVHRAARAAGRPLRELKRTSHGADHPIRFAEGAYLKALFAYAP
jgi:23S rRNA (cytosine1962-C5)-methyltransferase